MAIDTRLARGYPIQCWPHAWPRGTGPAGLLGSGSLSPIPASLLLIILYVAKRDWSPTIALFIGRANQIESNRQPNIAQRSPTISFFIGRASQIGSPTKPNEAQQSHFSLAGLVNASPTAAQQSPTTAWFIGRANQIGSPTKPNEAQQFHFSLAGPIKSVAQRSPTKPNNHMFHWQGS